MSPSNQKIYNMTRLGFHVCLHGLGKLGDMLGKALSEEF